MITQQPIKSYKSGTNVRSRTVAPTPDTQRPKNPSPPPSKQYPRRYCIIIAKETVNVQIKLNTANYFAAILRIFLPRKFTRIKEITSRHQSSTSFVNKVSHFLIILIEYVFIIFELAESMCFFYYLELSELKTLSILSD